MKSRGEAIQLRLIDDPAARRAENEDLVGRQFFDGRSNVRVARVCGSDPSQVLVERELDGKGWTVPAWLVRMIVGRERKKRAA